MDFPIPAKLRAILYVITAIGTPLVAYLQSKGHLGPDEVLLWSAEVSVVGAMAAFKSLKPDPPATDEALHALGHEAPPPEGFDG